ncbi:hypothetical protein [Leeia sp.]|uniref:hypothetical protein n=1 Tax=Leeia sp. TaxID=2884678 RepID=UPI0035B34579
MDSMLWVACVPVGIGVCGYLVLTAEARLRRQAELVLLYVGACLLLGVLALACMPRLAWLVPVLLLSLALLAPLLQSAEKSSPEPVTARVLGQGLTTVMLAASIPWLQQMGQ